MCGDSKDAHGGGCSLPTANEFPVKALPTIHNFDPAIRACDFVLSAEKTQIDVDSDPIWALRYKDTSNLNALQNIYEDSNFGWNQNASLPWSS